VVLVGEIIKLLFSAYLIIAEKEDSDASGDGFSKLLWLAVNAKKIILLVVLYSIGNILAYFALARVEASAYTVCLQLKALSTAAFAVLFLGRNISLTKWRALMLLVIGCILVASPSFNRCLMASTAKDSNSKIEVSIFESLLGLGAVLVMVTISGFSAVYFEGILKKSSEKITIWERNFQMALYSIVLLLLVIVSEGYTLDTPSSSYSTPFKGWTINTVLITIIQAGGGLLVAATLKYADAVLKTLATAGSIVLSAVLGHLLLGGVLDIFVGLGSLATILAIFNYTLDSGSA